MTKNKKKGSSKFVNTDPNSTKPCSNCGKIIPKANTYCYECGAEQITGAVQDAFEYESPKLSPFQSSRKKVNIDGLKCVRCESSDNLVFYKSSVNSKRETHSYPMKQIYTSSFSHEFPTCEKCVKNFNRWYLKYILFVISLGVFGIISYLIFQALATSYQVNNPSWWMQGGYGFFVSQEFFIFMIYAIISSIAWIIIFFIVKTLKTNPEQFIRITEYFDPLNKTFKYTPQVRPPSLKKWINYDEWLKYIVENSKN